jgi:hypothetical protein
MKETLMPDQRVEPHPILHDFTVVNDEIVQRNARKVPILIKREERCEYCATQRFTRIDVYRWQIVGSRQYKYVKGVQIVRMTKQEWLRKTFTATTKLADEDVAKLRVYLR